jgi:hypothetical protein
MNVFLQNILGMLPILGVHAFEQAPSVQTKGQSQTLICQGRGANASGRDTPQGFVVEAGSLAAPDVTPSLKKFFPSVIELRANLVKNGVLTEEVKGLRFNQDYTFNSPSHASAVILGRSSNGRTDWKDTHGKTLKDIQESQAKSQD